jgi:hypothetical protein
LRPLHVQLPDGRLVVYGGYYSLYGDPNPWVEYYNYNPVANTATVVGNVDPWLQSIGW